MKHLNTVYVAFLLRAWQEDCCVDGTDVPVAVWRFSLENPRSGERFGFDSWQAMIAHLLDVLEEAGGD